MVEQQSHSEKGTATWSPKMVTLSTYMKIVTCTIYLPLTKMKTIVKHVMIYKERKNPKHRPVKFSNKAVRDKGIQTSESHTGVDCNVLVDIPEVTTTASNVNKGNVVNENVTDVNCEGTEPSPEQTVDETNNKRYPNRNRRKPTWL